MQIHELNPLREGLLDRVKDIAKSAVSPAHQAQQQQAKTTQQGVASLGRLQAQGYGQTAAPQAGATLDKVKSNPQMQQYARTLAQQWMQKAASLSITPNQVAAKSKQPQPGTAATQQPATTSTGGTVQKTATGTVHRASPNNPNLAITPAQQPSTTSTGGTAQQTATGTVHRANPNNPNLVTNTPQTQPTGPVSVGGQKLNPRNPQDAKVLAALKAQGKISEAFANLPGGSQAVSAEKQYLEKFREWAAKTLTTRDPTTYQNITLDQIEKDPMIGRQLKQAQGQVVASRDNPARLEQAVTEYVITALAGVQQVIAATKAGTAPTVSASSTPAAAQGDITQDLASMGINPNQLRATGRMLQQKSGGNRSIRSSGDATVDEYLRQMGYQLR